MKSSTLSLLLACTPALLVAQASATATATANAHAKVEVPANYSASARAKIESSFEAARAKNLPEDQMQRRMAEGEAKGASDAQVAAAVQKTEARLEASQSAMVRAGRQNPSPEEVDAGEQAMERGTTEAQVEALAKHAPSDRSLTVAFNVLTKLQAQGRPVDRALAVIQAKLDARASDDALISLTNTNASATGSAATAANAHGANPNAAAAAATASGNAAAGVAKGTTGVAGSVTGAVGGVVGAKKP